MAKDLVNSAADGLLKETLTILESDGSADERIENAIDHLKLGLMARKLAAKRQGAKAEPKIATATATAKPSVNQTVTPAPTVSPAVAAQANGKTDTKAGWLGK